MQPKERTKVGRTLEGLAGKFWDMTRYLFFPWNISLNDPYKKEGNHWVAFIVDFQMKEILYYCLKNATYNFEVFDLGQIRNVVHELIAKSWVIWGQVFDWPLQTDSWNCVFYVLSTCFDLAMKVKLGDQERDMTIF